MARKRGIGRWDGRFCPTPDPARAARSGPSAESSDVRGRPAVKRLAWQRLFCVSPGCDRSLAFAALFRVSRECEPCNVTKH